MRRGIPYSLHEARAVLKEHKLWMDPYHHQLMAWLVGRASLAPDPTTPTQDKGKEEIVRSEGREGL